MEWVLKASGLTKSFAGIHVLRDASLQLRPGEVHALMGENGAGKSTFMKIVSGVLTPDAGEMLVDGRPVPRGSPHAALRAGVAMIYQELSPFLDLSVAENILMGLQPVGRVTRFIKRRAMNRIAAELLRQLGTPLPPYRRLRDLRVAEMQVVEIAKALAHQARVIIMDEPTSALSEAEAEALFRTIRELRNRGVAIIYISHKLDEVFRLADRITVLRDGAVVETGPREAFTPDSLIRLMVGRDVPAAAPSGDSSGQEVLLEVKGLSNRGRFDNISFTVHAGEILGLAGLMGAGRTEIVNAIFGLEPAHAGEIRVRGRPVRIRRPQAALRAGIGLVTEDRKRYGIIPSMGVPENVTLAALKQCCAGLFLRRSAERQAANDAVCSLGIRARQIQQPVERLSGGNQQKVVLGRTLFTGPDVLLLDEPTRGIDVNARAEIHHTIRKLAQAGKAVVLVSSEMPELLALSHRILVLRQGQIAGSLSRDQATPERILQLAMPQ